MRLESLATPPGTAGSLWKLSEFLRRLFLLLLGVAQILQTVFGFIFGGELVSFSQGLLPKCKCAASSGKLPNCQVILGSAQHTKKYKIFLESF